MHTTLTHPAYAGAYVDGRSRMTGHPRITISTRWHPRRRYAPRDDAVADSIEPVPFWCGTWKPLTAPFPTSEGILTFTTRPQRCTLTTDLGLSLRWDKSPTAVRRAPLALVKVSTDEPAGRPAVAPRFPGDLRLKRWTTVGIVTVDPLAGRLSGRLTCQPAGGIPPPLTRTAAALGVVATNKRSA